MNKSKRRRKEVVKKDAERILQVLKEYTKEIGVNVPIEIIEYDRLDGEGRCLHLIKISIGTETYLDGFEGPIEELIGVLKEIVRVEARKIKVLISKARRERVRAFRELNGLEAFLREIESHVESQAIITVGGDDLANPWEEVPKDVLFLTDLVKAGGGEIISWDVSYPCQDEIAVYGANPNLWPRFYKWFVDSLKRSRRLGIVLRSFKDGIEDELTHLPVKEIRGYFVEIEGGEVRYHQLSAKEMLEVHTLHPSLGKLKPEPSVIYCGPGNDKIYSAIKDDSM